MESYIVFELNTYTDGWGQLSIPFTSLEKAKDFKESSKLNDPDWILQIFKVVE